MTSQPGKQTVAIHILPNIPRSTDNQIIKYGQLIEYNMGNIFLEKSYTKSRAETIPRPFFKKSKFIISLDQQSKVLHSLFNCIPTWQLSKYLETKPHTTYFYLILSSFKKTKISLELVIPASFFALFLKKKFSWYILSTNQIWFCDCLYFLRFWAVCVLQLFVN